MRSTAAYAPGMNLPVDSAAATMRILVIDDHALFRCGLQMLLSQLVSQTEIFEAANAPEALNIIASGQPFDLVLMDWHMPGASGDQAIKMLRDALPNGRLVILSGDQSPKLIRSCVELGVAGYIPKEAPPQALLHALSIVMRGGIYLPSDVPMGFSAASPASYMLNNVADSFPDLTPRQCEVLCAMAQGLSNKVIARSLGISEDTVKQHLNVVYGVLQVHNRTEAVYVLAKRGVKVG
jgi:two-component system nitrate/nitrite response regulator NarL